jgi:hypothetical protein
VESVKREGKRLEKTIKEQTNLTMRIDIKKRANGAVDNGCITGISSLTGLVEKALEDYLDRNKIPKKFEL